MRDIRNLILLLLPALAIYGYFVSSLWFTQDDAYISYRYVANWLNGDGLVYNIGERVEGFTNFGWVIILGFIGRLGLDYIFFSKLIGLLCGVGVITATFLIARQVVSEDRRWAPWLATYLVAASASLAYWSQAGLETAAFALVATFSLYWYLRGSYLLIWGLLIAVWLRPDGVVLAGVLIGTEWILTRRLPKFTFTCATFAAVLSLPMVGFKLSYYHSLLPNPFHAKTAADWGQVLSGAEYSAEFFRHYGFFGLGILVVVLLWKKLNGGQQAAALFFIGYSLYITCIGGDVLKVHRFYLPALAAAAVVTVTALQLLIRYVASGARTVVTIAVSALLLGLTVYGPRQTVLGFHRNEIGLTAGMRWMADAMLKTDSSDFSVATTTIGIFGYQLVGHTVIDMLGLCDSTIARHPEPPIPGMSTTWKESNYNAAYVLGRKPDYVLFSTDIKPSAPAEKALMLYEEFISSYRGVGWFIRDPRYNPRSMPVMAFKRFRQPQPPFTPQLPIAWVDLYKLGCEQARREPRLALESFAQAQSTLGKQRLYPELLFLMGGCYNDLGHPTLGPVCYEQAIAADSFAAPAHAALYVDKSLKGDATAAIHKVWLARSMPWQISTLDTLVARQVRERKPRR